MAIQRILIKQIMSDTKRSVAACLVAVLSFFLLPLRIHFETRIIAAWDAGVVALLILTFMMMLRCSPEETAQRARDAEASNVVILCVALLFSISALAGVAYGQTKIQGLSMFAVVLRASLSVVAVIGSWLVTHTAYTLYYAAKYYDETNDGSPSDYAGGLEFPGDKARLDYWDFAYYSFTIGMCFQTSDVSISSPEMRRISLFHAIISCFFIMVVLSLLVNILANVI
ncbi:MAG: DUF1345 domain-containing protein [candidate division NC10 bacterium]